MALFIFSYAFPAYASDQLRSRINVTLEYLNDSLSDTTKFEEEIEWTLKGDKFSLFTRYGNDWPFPNQVKEERLLKRSLSLDLGDIDVTAGNFSYVLGRGIVLKANEERQLGWDSMLDGILWQFNRDDWDAGVFYGLHKTGTPNDFPIGVDTVGDPDRLWGGRVGHDFGDLNVGAYYLNSFIQDDFEQYKDAFMGFEVAMNIEDWRLLYEQDFRDTYQGFDDGRAHYAELSGGWADLAVTLQYKDYWKMVFPYSSPPRLRRGDSEEGSINANDEKGYMATLVYNPEFIGESYITAIFAASEDTERLEPFHEFYIEYQHDPLKDTTFTIAHDYIKGALQSANYLTAQYHDYIFELDHVVSDEDSMHVHLRFTTIDTETDDEEEKEIGVDYNLGEDLTLTLFYETSTKPYEPPPIGSNQFPTESPGEWFAFKAFYDVDDDTSLEFTWGSKRGGYECSGGTCVQIPPFKGIQLIVRRQI